MAEVTNTLTKEHIYYYTTVGTWHALSFVTTKRSLIDTGWTCGPYEARITTAAVIQWLVWLPPEGRSFSCPSLSPFLCWPCQCLVTVKSCAACLNRIAGRAVDNYVPLACHSSSLWLVVINYWCCDVRTHHANETRRCL